MDKKLKEEKGKLEEHNSQKGHLTCFGQSAVPYSTGETILILIQQVQEIIPGSFETRRIHFCDKHGPKSSGKENTSHSDHISEFHGFLNEYGLDPDKRSDD